MPYAKPRWWQEVPWHLIVVAVAVVGLAVGLMMLMAKFANAGGPVTVTWDQSADCGAVTGWELVLAPITTQNPNPQPTAAVLGVTILNTGTPPCGAAMTKQVTINAGVGPQRFWIRALAGAAKSRESNAIDSSLPFTAPGLTSVVP